MAGRIHFDYVDAAVFTDGEARASSQGSAAGEVRPSSWQLSARHDPCRGGFLRRERRTAETHGPDDRFRKHCAGFDQRLLTDEGRKVAGTVFPRQNEVLAGFTIDQDVWLKKSICHFIHVLAVSAPCASVELRYTGRQKKSQGKIGTTRQVVRRFLPDLTGLAKGTSAPTFTVLYGAQPSGLQDKA